MALIPGSRGLWVFSALLVLASLQSTGADDIIAIKWDIMAWTGDGYVVNASMYNTHKFLGIYHLGWTWNQKEVIYNVIGAQATEQGDCTGLPAPPPHSCVRTPDIVKDVVNSVSSFQMTVGRSGNTNESVKVPDKLTLKSPGPADYTCSDLKIVAPTRFPQINGTRHTQAYVTWNATCTESV